MKYKSAFIKDVKEICKKLRWEFYVNEYHMDIDWNDKDEDDGKFLACASISIDLKYLTFTINIFPNLQEMWTKDKDKFIEVLVHEFSHLLTEPLYMFGVEAVTNPEQKHLEEIRERQTQRISNIITPYLKKELIKKKK